jgi:ubiquinone/menaquinone biosynthesis C-methylase UbiE
VALVSLDPSLTMSCPDSVDEGLFLQSLANGVGAEGKVHATEVSEVFVSHLAKKVETENFKNVTLELVASDASTFLSVPCGTVDIAFICDVYHHFEYPKTTLRGIVSFLTVQSQVIFL